MRSRVYKRAGVWYVDAPNMVSPRAFLYWGYAMDYANSNTRSGRVENLRQRAIQSVRSEYW